LDNNDVAAMLDEIGDLLEIVGESSFRVGAYRKAAQVIRSLPQDINELDREDKLTSIAGVGKGLAERVHELLSTGKMTYFEQLKEQVPESLAELVHVPGLGPKKARLIYDRLGIKELPQLKQALAQKRLRELPGMGAKTEENILRGLKQYEQQTSRLLLSQAMPAAEKVVNALLAHDEALTADPAGSLRRWRETIGDIDILCSTDRPQAVADIFCSLPDTAHVLAKGAKKCSVILKNALQVDLRLIRPSEYGAALQYFTGSKAHNIKIREIAKKKGFKLSEYGVFDVGSGKLLAGATEEEVYRLIGLQWIDPMLREDRGEIEAAATGRLPNLIDSADIKGDLHTHTKATDGQSGLAEMAEFAQTLGYSYLAVCDHAVNLKVAGGLEAKEFEAQWREIERLNEGWNDFRLLKGVELNIDNEGRVDFPGEFLRGFDVVAASIHGGFNQEKQRLTDRMLAAIANPFIHMICHPTGRILGRRAPYQIDLPAIFEAAAKTGTILELNSFPDRLDLRDDYLLEAKRVGCRFSINTDAHHSGQLSYLRYGLATARRGWLEASDVVNTYRLDRLKRALISINR
jgi:DNA polymerase (family X)